MSEPLIKISGLSKSFHRDSVEVRALERIDLEVFPGDFVCLMGPSGSGKSTLLNIIAGLDRPSEGSVIVAGENLNEMSEDELAAWRNHHIGFVFQHFNLIPVLTAFENVELPLLLTSLTKKERREHVMTAMNLVGLTDRIEHYPRQLSGGQEQRVAIARAIVTDPTCLLADEPTGNLDAVTGGRILELLLTLHQQAGTTIVMVTHSQEVAARADRRLRLDSGQIREITP